MDFDFQIFLPLAFSLFIAISAIFVIFVSGKKSQSFPDYASAVPVIEVIKILEKICPISCENEWKLFPIESGCHRTWTHSMILPFLESNVTLHGSSIIINSSSSNICSLITDVTKWPEWNPFFSSQYIVKSFHDKQLKRDHYMEAEQVIAIVREANRIQSHTITYRFHDFSENKVGWILMWNPKKLEFLYFLAQPIKNGSENPSCLLTHIVGSKLKHTVSSVSLVSQRLRNIQDLLVLSSLCIVPSKFMLTLQHSNLEDHASKDKSKPLSSNDQENYFSLSSIRTRKSDVRNTVFILVPFIRSIHEFWKTNIEFKLAVKNMEAAPSEEKLPLSASSLVSTSSNSANLPKEQLRRAASEAQIKPKIQANVQKCSFSSDKSNYTYVSENKKINSEFKDKLIKLSEHNSGSSGHSETKKKSPSKKLLPNSKFYCSSSSETAINNLAKGENIEAKLLVMDEQDSQEIFSSSISDFEIVESSELTENRRTAFVTQGNYSAAELQAEVLVASQFLHDMNSGNYQSLGGWMFHSCHKGLCVLIKTTCSQFLKIDSFLCQTEIPVAPKDVWKFVKNPQFRFICDESVKSVEVLDKISNSQKLIHTYHEVSGFIKKELIDFCLLQTEREEFNKYYSCFCSIEFDKCPFMNTVTRGTLRPSGWIVEKIENDPNKSVVTFMIQGLVSSPDSLFIQELSTMVPQSVLNLKNYIMSKPV